MNQVCVHPDLLLGLLEEIGRIRALADHETDLVEAIVCRGHRSAGLRVQWTQRLDRGLLTAAQVKGGIRRYALKNNIDPGAAYDRLRKLRKAELTLGAAGRRVAGL